MKGTVLNNRYEIIQQVGEGGMAIVYKALDVKLNRFVAIKVLKNEFTNDLDVVYKFKSEATAIAHLNDSNIISIFDVGAENNINYIVMEYISGKTLKELIKENFRLSHERTIEIAIKIASALECAHRNGIIHRDVKPQNILITREGVVKVTDFGIAKASTSVTITHTNKIMGSAHYLSPEQAKGIVVDCRTDIYSLGIVMYEMITGRLPFNGDTPVAIALKQIQEIPTNVRVINTSTPEKLEYTIMKCIEKDPNNRYQTAKQLLIDLYSMQREQSPNMTMAMSGVEIEDDSTRVMDASEIESELQKTVVTKKINVDKENDLEEDEEEDDDNIFDGRSKNKISPKTKKGLIIALAVVVLLGLGGGAALIAFNSHGKTDNTKTEDKKSEEKKTEVQVPSLKGKTENDAREALTKLGLIADVQKEESDEDEGTVIRVTPSEGANVNKNTKVTIVISSGPKKVSVPSVEGMYQDSIKRILESNGLVVGTITKQNDDKVEEGNVISQDPPRGTQVAKGSKVDIVISMGPKIVNKQVPNVEGKSYSEAESILNSDGFKVARGNAIKTTEKSLDNTVKSQSIKGGTAQEGSTITLEYYQYEAKKITVSNVFGSATGKSAKQQLQALSSKFGISIAGAGETDLVDKIIVNGSELAFGSSIEVEENTSIVIITKKQPDNSGSGSGSGGTGTGTGSGSGTGSGTTGTGSGQSQPNSVAPGNVQSQPNSVQSGSGKPTTH